MNARNSDEINDLCTPGTLSFECNICGTPSHVQLNELDRETISCRACGSNLRFRSIVDALSERLFGHSISLVEFPANRFFGIGLSDAPAYADRLAKKLQYTNTFYHTEPRFDITDIASTHDGQYDFVLASDVFEHVAPPVQRAFDNLFRVLKPGGSVIFSVPFSLDEDTVEHFPNLHDWRIEPSGSGFVLLNRTADGRHEVFNNLIFHGGPGSTLEMRLFSRSALERHFMRAGLTDFRVHDAPNFAHGIYWRNPWSITVSARRPV